MTTLSSIRHLIRTEGCWVAINKPLGTTSNHTTKRIAKILQAFLYNPPKTSTTDTTTTEKKNKTKLIKVGHTGTLDPTASGTLVIAIGRCSKFLRYFNSNNAFGEIRNYNGVKVYETTMILGKSTRTDDANARGEGNWFCPDCNNENWPIRIKCNRCHKERGDVNLEEEAMKSQTNEIIREVDMSWMTKEHVDLHLPSFLGEIMQRPPTVSSKHIKGVRIHKLEREGLLNPNDILPVPVRIDELEVLGFRPGKLPELDLKMTCGGGVYVRSVARDLGLQILKEKLGEEMDDWNYTDFPQSIPGCGSLLTLKRLECSGFNMHDTIDLDDLISLFPALEEDEDGAEHGDPISGCSDDVISKEQEETWSKFKNTKDTLLHLDLHTISLLKCTTVEQNTIMKAWLLKNWIPIDVNQSTTPLLQKQRQPNLDCNAVRVVIDNEFMGTGTLSECKQYVRKEITTLQCV